MHLDAQGMGAHPSMDDEGRSAFLLAERLWDGVPAHMVDRSEQTADSVDIEHEVHEVSRPIIRAPNVLDLPQVESEGPLPIVAATDIADAGRVLLRVEAVGRLLQEAVQPRGESSGL